VRKMENKIDKLLLETQAELKEMKATSKEIKAALKETKTALSDLRSEMKEGFKSLHKRIDRLEDQMLMEFEEMKREIK
jgi:5-bromo-4-chloroindolyl phosphate hydrolysis protein